MRTRMVTEQLQSRGITETAVLHAMGTVPREHFVADTYQTYAYNDGPLPIGERQTISQPYVVAFMIQLLELTPQSKVLEIGTGSGYAAAVLSLIAAQVVTVERHEKLVWSARERLAAGGYDNVIVMQGDGTLGCEEFAPYDGIIVAAGGPSIPISLKEQLKVGSKLVMPIGNNKRKQQLYQITRNDTYQFREKRKGSVSFVPLVGQAGWHEA
ncbi:MAG: protein-L-isoaspartate O-methyltransferase [Chloroflexi bacterium]|nr:MAG: protein-L-isoaspartate O-methyltransferase [Chloroflexota bacterium]